MYSLISSRVNLEIIPFLRYHSLTFLFGNNWNLYHSQNLSKGFLHFSPSWRGTEAFHECGGGEQGLAVSTWTQRYEAVYSVGWACSPQLGGWGTWAPSPPLCAKWMGPVMEQWVCWSNKSPLGARLPSRFLTSSMPLSKCLNLECPFSIHTPSPLYLASLLHYLRPNSGAIMSQNPPLIIPHNLLVALHSASIMLFTCHWRCPDMLYCKYQNTRQLSALCYLRAGIILQLCVPAHCLACSIRSLILNNKSLQCF